MHIDELRAPYGYSRWTIYWLVKEGVLTEPPRGRYGLWTQKHRDQLRAYVAIQHNNIRTREAVQHCVEEGIDLPEFVDRRAESVREFGIGVA